MRRNRTWGHAAGGETGGRQGTQASSHVVRRLNWGTLVVVVIPKPRPTGRVGARVVLAALLVLAAVSGCARPDQAPNTPTDKAPAQEMIGFRVSNSKPPLAEQDPGTKLRYEVGADGVFRGTVEIHNLRPAAHDYLLTMYVDYVQTPFVVEGKTYRSYTERRLGPNIKRWIQFEIGPLPRGTHDLSAAAVSDISDHDLTEAQRWASGDFGNISARVNLIVGGSESTPTLPALAPAVLAESIKAPDGSVRPGASIERPLFNDTADGYGVITSIEASAGATLACFAHVANTTDATRSYALIPTVDGQQVASGKGDPIVLFAVIAPGEIRTFRLALPCPDTPGTHELQLLGSVNPFSRLADETYGDSQMEESLRTALVLE